MSELNHYSFIETDMFTRQVDSKASLDVLYAIKNDLLDTQSMAILYRVRAAFVRRVSLTRKAAEASAAAFATYTCTLSIAVAYTCYTSMARVSRATYLQSKRRPWRDWRR